MVGVTWDVEIEEGEYVYMYQLFKFLGKRYKGKALILRRLNDNASRADD